MVLPARVARPAAPVAGVARPAHAEARRGVAGPAGVVVGLVLGLLSGGAGCAAGDATAMSLHRLDGELVRLRAQNAALSERVDALEIRADGARALPVAAAPGAAALAPRQDDRPELEVVRLVPGAPRAKVEAVAPSPTTDRAARAELAVAELGRADALLASEKYDAALDAYAAFVVRFPEHPRAAEATMRRGECYLQKREPERAAEHIEAALAGALPPALAPAALSLLARAHEAAGDEAAAARVRARLRNDFPDHPAVKTLASRQGSR